MLYRGDGSQRSDASLPPVMTTVTFETSPGAAPTGFLPGNLRPRGLAMAPDGSLYVAVGFPEDEIRRVDPSDGTIRTAVGAGASGFSGDGGPATAALIRSPVGMVFGPDGSLYFGDTGNSRVRRVSPAGIITTVAGNGLGTVGPFGVPATQAGIRSPSWLALDRDGNLYLSSFAADRIFKVTTQGILELFAGTGSESPLEDPGDGGLATAAVLANPQGIDVGADGSVYVVTQQNGQRVRRITAEGRISTVAGTGIQTPSAPDGGAAADTGINFALDLLFGREGELLIADGSNRVRRVASPLPGFAVGEILAASEDGSEVYRFDAQGRHLETRDGLTLAPLLSFAYTAEGTLDAITDADGNETRVIRAGAAPTAIEAPFGQRTDLALDANGWLRRVENPAGEAHTMLSTAEGLLTRFERPGGGASTFLHDALGRLTRDTDPEGGFTELTRVPGALGDTVGVTTGEGVQEDAAIEFLATGDRRRMRVDGAGLTTLIVDGLDARETTNAPDGTVVVRAEGPDPRFGLAAPIAKSLQIETPGGLLFERTQARTATTDPLTGQVESQTDTTSVNGRTSAVAYDGATGVVTTTTAEGRLLRDVLDARGRLVETQVDGLLAVRLAYDARGRLSALAQGAGAAERIVSFGYDAEGNLAGVTDPLLRTVGFLYDAAGRVTRQTLPDGRFITFSYDANGNLASLTPPGQPAHVFRYTLRDQESEYEPPDVVPGDPRTFFTYDLDRNLERVDRPDGKVIALGYDGAGRLQAVTTPRGTATQTYHPTTGNVSSITAPGGEGLAFAYDGALVTSTTWSGTISGTVSHAYDDDLRVASQSVNGASTAPFSYDDDGLLIGAGALTLGRDPLNGLLTGTALSSVTTARAYSAFGELGSDSANVGAAPAYENVYTRDWLGRITRKVETLQGTTTVFDYGYDLAGWLETVTINGATARVYAYDANGNRLSVTDHAQEGAVTSGVYDARDRLLSYGTSTYTYNAAGDLTSRTDLALPPGQQTTTYVYDALGNLISVTLPDGRLVEYVIDGQNRRVGKKVNGTLVQGWLYQDQLEPVAELDGAGNVVSRFVYGSRPNVPDYMVRGGVTYRVLSDHLGSPRLVVNASSGVVAQRLDYDEFGRVLADTNPGFQPFGFAGGIYGADTGLVRFGARDYDGETARWLAPDSARFEGRDSNLYRYSLGDPLNWYDPDGQTPLVALAWCATNPACASLATATAAAFVWGAANTYQYLFGPVASPAPLCQAAQQSGEGGDDAADSQPHKVPKPGVSGKEGAKDVPSWAKGERPKVGESGKDFADRLLGRKYGPGNYPKGPGSEHSKIQKWGDRAFQDP